MPVYWIRLILLLAAGFSVCSINAGKVYAQPAPSREYQLKAVFLFNFLPFTEWPETAFPTADAPIRMGVLGEDPFGQALDEAVQGETVRGRKLIVQRSRRLEDLQGCHLLFIGRSETRRIDEIIAWIGSQPILTVSEIDDFARNGGIIEFFTEGKKVRFEINPSAAQRQGLKISSQLLGLGRIVAVDTPQGGR